MSFYNDNEEENELHIAWPNYSPEKQQQSSLLPLVLMINEKLREQVEFVRQEVGKLCSLPILVNLLPSQRNSLFEKNPKLKKYWVKMEQKFQQLPPEEFEKIDFSRRLLWRLLQRLKRTVDFIDDESKDLEIDAVTYCERLLSFLIDLEAQLTTRRFFNSLLHSSHILTHCCLSQFIRSEHGSLFCELFSMLKFYARFEIDELSGQQLLQAEVTKRHYEFVSQLQAAAFKFLNEKLTEFCLLPVGSVDSSKFLREQLGSLSCDDLYKLAEFLNLVPSLSEKEENLVDNYCRYDDPNYLIEAIIFVCERRPSQLQRLNAEPLYPSEKLIPYDHYDGKSVLPLNKLNLQFLTTHDYLLRNFNLFRMESTYEIRLDLEDVMFRMKPWKHEFNESDVVWGGWAKMALPVTSCRIVHVGRPLVGESAPSEVRADLQITLPSREDLRQDWMSLRKNDVLFLLKVKPIQKVGYKFDFRQSREAIRKMEGDLRTFRIRFDPNQYKEDFDNGNIEDIYFSFNLVIRRDPKSNNFKSVLATIRQLLNTECVVPDWLLDLILGYGEPDIAHYSRITNTVATVDFNDTFLSFEHLQKSFPNKKIICEESVPKPPFRLTFKEFVPQHNIEKEEERDTSIIVENQKVFNRILTETYQKNNIEFTPLQIEAIKSGMQPGLTLVVGPPGTGKTDVAVQIISNIYHNWPEQRTLIVTHSNQALNQIFEKIICLDVDERHLLRMGHGEEALETDKDFSRYGRVNYVLAERKRLLERVEKLCESMEEVGDVSYSCETAGYFFRYSVCKTWENFLELIEQAKQTAINDAKENNNSTDSTTNVPLPSKDFVADNFPFTKFFQSGKKKKNFLPLEFKVKESKIIAMTCTHAALRRRELVELGFRYDNILMEEAAQILEVETFIPLLLQKISALVYLLKNFFFFHDPHDGRSRLKRWIMIGDNHQLPPIVQNVAYQKYSNMEQSLFARLIRLGVPHIQLNCQGRARSELANLYNWRYKNLGDLKHVLDNEEFKLTNAGFLYNYQLINVPDFNGIGESTPSAYFYQNLGEAEFAVALFVYMRILGYPSEKISILTTYNGQASLLRDIINKRCTNNPLIGMPGK
uniref:Intron-binding protein aquarius n=1 Tax=Meloidogyne javanica TaxID=6303 RepID=A0A915LBP5_MELJA